MSLVKVVGLLIREGNTENEIREITCEAGEGWVGLRPLGRFTIELTDKKFMEKITVGSKLEVQVSIVEEKKK